MSRLPQVLAVLLVLFSSVPALAGAVRYERDRSVDLDDLARTGQVAVQSNYRGYDVTADASAVLTRVDFAKLKALSVDFNRWARMGMPGVEAMYIVRQPSPTQMLVWIHMTNPGGSTQHYQNIAIVPSIGNQGAFGNSFELTHPAQLSRLTNGQTLGDDPAFSSFEGSWYLEPLGNGRVYVRYFVDATVDSGIPAFLVGPIARSSMVDGIREMIRIFAAQARTP